MEKREAIEILNKMAAGIRKYSRQFESSDEREREEIRAWNEKKVAALEYAVNSLLAEDKIKRLQTMAHEVSAFIDGLVEEEGETK